MNNPPFSVETAKKLHSQGKAIKLHGEVDTMFLKPAVYGATDGIITTFAVVAGVIGAQLSPVIVVILGIANLLGDGVSMAFADYLGERSEQRHRKYSYSIEQWEIENIPEEETKELHQFFSHRGVAPKDTKELTTIIKKYPDLWSELGFIDEMGVSPHPEAHIWRSGAVTFCAFVTAGFLPLTPYVFQLFGFSYSGISPFLLSSGATAASLFFVGSLRTFLTKGKWWQNGLEVLIIGTIAASVAFFVGAFIEKLV